MAAIERLTSLLAKLKGLMLPDPGPSVVVSYTAAYALWVHENLEAHHPIGQAKFLESPAREMGPELGDQIKADVQKGMALEKALLRAGLKLQRASMKLCPVDTGALRASANTSLEEK